MKATTRMYTRDAGWWLPIPTELDSESTLAVVFGASGYFDDAAPFRDLRRSLPRSVIVGCSTAGEICATRLSDESIVVAILRLDKSGVRSATAAVASVRDSFDAGAKLARALSEPGLRGIFVLSDGLAVNGSELARGINSVVAPGVVVTGGLAGDGAAFQRTWVLADDAPRSGYVSAVGFYGDSISITHGSKGGWDIFGPERVVTRSAGNVLYELDGNPALELYKRYLGERAAGLPATALLFPLALRAEPGDPKRLVRSVLAVDEATQSMTFAGDIPQGSLAQLMKANFDRLIQGASDAASLSVGPGTQVPRVCFAISGVGRRLVLGQRVEDELEATLEVLPADTMQVGFYSNGELSPYIDGPCDLHNQTMTLTTLSEA